MMNAAYAVVITQVVLIVLEFLMVTLSLINVGHAIMILQMTVFRIVLETGEEQLSLISVVHVTVIAAMTVYRIV